MEFDREQAVLAALLKYLYRSKADEPLLARYLLKERDSLRCLVQSRREVLTLEHQLPDSVALFLSTLPGLARYTQAEKFRPPAVLNCLEKIQGFLDALYLGKVYEELYLIALNARMQLIGFRMIQQGTLREVSMPVRQILEAINEMDARYVLLAHNHPSESDHFSLFDQEATTTFLRTMTGLRIPVLDHLLYVSHCCYSMRLERLIDEEVWMETAPNNLSREEWLYGAAKSPHLLPRR